MKDDVDKVLHQGYGDGSGSDNYVSVDQYLDMIKGRNSLAFLPETIDPKKKESVLRYLYNNRTVKINNKSFIYMLVKYTFNKSIIDNPRLTNEQKEIPIYTNKEIFKLLKTYPGMGHSQSIDTDDLDYDSDDSNSSSDSDDEFMWDDNGGGWVRRDDSDDSDSDSD